MDNTARCHWLISRGSLSTLYLNSEAVYITQSGEGAWPEAPHASKSPAPDRGIEKPSELENLHLILPQGGCPTPGRQPQCVLVTDFPPPEHRWFDAGSHLGHIGFMSAVAKSRIDPELKRQAEAVLEEIGLKPRAALELFYKQIIKRRAIPFPVQADSPEDEVLSTAVRRNQLADEF